METFLRNEGFPCFGEQRHTLHTYIAVPFKVNARALQHVDGVARVEVHENVKVKVELPTAGARRLVAVLVKERNAELDELEAVDVVAGGAGRKGRVRDVIQARQALKNTPRPSRQNPHVHVAQQEVEVKVRLVAKLSHRCSHDARKFSVLKRGRGVR